ncbi:dimethyladenosine transferase 2, mitochondrial [Vespa velutina]|uniref:dimethyladenosine transferase 2, mitochondrial n=1 Tax=Vespa velutina TaxID=202808 RepID=UPI001FB47490|nr:dimethyladenosine transferase 2, mitochondrial [Vespa velutina]
MNVNFMSLLIKHIEKDKSHYFTLFLTHRKFCLSMNFLHPRSISQETTEEIDLKTNDNEVKIDNKKTASMKLMKTMKSEYENLNIKDYIKLINPQYIEVCPKIYLGYTSNISDVSYLISENGAKNFVDLIIDDLSKNMTFVAEANPGAGVLTKELLEAGVKIIRIYEPNECFYPLLRKLQKKYPDRLEIRKANILKMSKLYFLDQQDNKERINEVLKDVPYVHWENETCMQVIGAIINYRFLKHLICSVVFRTSFMLQGRTSFYLAITPSLWNIISNPQNKAAFNFLYIIYQTLFDCKYLGDIERLFYIPWPRNSLKQKKLQVNDNKILKVVKIEPKADLFKNTTKPIQIISYWYFVKYHLKSKEQRVIPELEKWIPGCGIRLIQKNYNIFTRFVDLTPLEFLDLYEEFVSWPEYENCLFLTSAYSYIHIVNQNTEFTDTLNFKGKKIFYK